MLDKVGKIISFTNELLPQLFFPKNIVKGLISIVVVPLAKRAATRRDAPPLRSVALTSAPCNSVLPLITAFRLSLEILKLLSTYGHVDLTPIIRRRMAYWLIHNYQNYTF